MAPKRGLGRGLSNLIPTDDTTEVSVQRHRNRLKQALLQKQRL